MFNISSPKNKNKSNYEPAAIIPMSLTDNDDSNQNIRHEKDKISLTSNIKSKINKKQSPSKSSSKSNKSKSNKKNNKNKKQSYVMISTSFDDGDYDIDEEDDEFDGSGSGSNNNQSDDEQVAGQRKMSQNTQSSKELLGNINYDGSTLSTSQVNAEQDDDDSDDEDNLIEIQLNSPMNDKYDNGNNHHESTLMDDDDIDGRNGKMQNKYGVSVLFGQHGLRLNYDGKSKCHDCGWSIIWILHCIVIVGVLVIVWTSEHVHMPHARNGIFILCFLLAFAVIFAFLWTFLLKYCGGFIVWVLILGNLIFIAAFASFAFIVGDRFKGLGIIFTILFVIFSIFTLLIRKRITYTIALLQLGSSILVTTPSALMVAFGVLLSQIVWIFVWGAIVVAWTAQYYHTDSSSDFGGILLILLLSFIWNHQVIKNIGHTTICAVISHWYFVGNVRPFPTCKALLRCLTTSLGSIAYGSLFINALQGIRSYLRVIKDEGFGCCSCGKYILNCCLSGFDGLLSHFNTYAFVHVALYNTAYLKSGKQTYDVLSTSPILPLMNSDFTEYALLCGSICGGIINAILASWVSNIMVFSTDWVVLFTCGGFLIGMSLSSSLLNAVSSCVICLMVLYAEEPKVLIELHPEQALRFDGAKKGIA